MTSRARNGLYPSMTRWGSHFQQSPLESRINRSKTQLSRDLWALLNTHEGFAGGSILTQTKRLLQRLAFHLDLTRQ